MSGDGDRRGSLVCTASDIAFYATSGLDRGNQDRQTARRATVGGDVSAGRDNESRQRGWSVPAGKRTTEVDTWFSVAHDHIAFPTSRGYAIRCELARSRLDSAATGLGYGDLRSRQHAISGA